MNVQYSFLVILFADTGFFIRTSKFFGRLGVFLTFWKNKLKMLSILAKIGLFAVIFKTILSLKVFLIFWPPKPCVLTYFVLIKKRIPNKVLNFFFSCTGYQRKFIMSTDRATPITLLESDWITNAHTFASLGAPAFWSRVSFTGCFFWGYLWCNKHSDSDFRTFVSVGQSLK